MGIYFNPGNESFNCDIRSLVYVDKTGLLAILNRLLGTSNKCIALSHARRFGKSQAAGMIDAYYSCGSDSRELFARFNIAGDPDFATHLNKYNVIHLDISSVADSHREDLVDNIMERLFCDFQQDYGDCCGFDSLERILSAIYRKSGTPFVIIIDEWDCVVRNHADRPDLVHRYMQFLHSIFKSEEAKSFLALGYITGILPIKKIHDESALNNFREYTMLDSYELTEFFGFTETEVQTLCAEHGMDFDSMKKWYDGYRISGHAMYNPNSVCLALWRKKLDSWWKNTSSFETINLYIKPDHNGLKEAVLSMLAGGREEVDVSTFANDLSVIRDRDEALTALIHLGYLGYDSEAEEAFIPNFEVARAWQDALKVGDWSEISKTLSRCDNLLKATVRGDADLVANLVELAHDTYASILRYNDENSLACAISMAYFTAPAYYNIVREMPAGKGFADLAFIPRREAGNRPAMIIELKWNDTADTAIRQIRERRYEGALVSYAGEILLVGISYAKNAADKKHFCVIEKLASDATQAVTSG